MMEDPYAKMPEDWREGRQSLVRPYVTASGPNTEGLPGETAGSDPFDFLDDDDLVGPQVPVPEAGLDEIRGSAKREDLAGDNDTRLLADRPAKVRSRPPAKPSGPRSAGRGTPWRALTAVALVGATAMAGTLFFVLQGHPKVTSMGGCGPAHCHGAPASSSVATPGPSVVVGAHVPMLMTASPVATPTTGAPTSTATFATNAPSTSATSGSTTVSPGSVISIEATTACCRSFSIAHDDNDNGVVITEVTSASSQTERADASWLVQQGLADSSCFSFESVNAPGEYLMHHDFELFLNPNDGSDQFASAATFCPQPGNSGQGYSLESYNDPNTFIRHFDYVVFTASDGGSNPWDTPTLWRDDSTWNVIRPWG